MPRVDLTNDEYELILREREKEEKPSGYCEDYPCWSGELAKVCGSCVQKPRPVPGLTEHSIAQIAQQATHLACFVVVVNAEVTGFGVRAADSASTVLCKQHGLELFEGDAVLRLEFGVPLVSASLIRGEAGDVLRLASLLPASDAHLVLATGAYVGAPRGVELDDTLGLSTLTADSHSEDYTGVEMRGSYCIDYPCCGHTPADPCTRQWYDHPDAFNTRVNPHALCNHEDGDCDVEPDEVDPDECQHTSVHAYTRSPWGTWYECSYCETMMEPVTDVDQHFFESTVVPGMWLDIPVLVINYKVAS